MDINLKNLLLGVKQWAEAKFQGTISDIEDIRNNALSGKAAYDSLGNYYTKSETDSELAKKSDLGHTHNSGEVILSGDITYSGEVLSHSGDTIHKSIVDLLGKMVDNEETTSTAINGKQDKISDIETIRNNSLSGKTAYDSLANYYTSGKTDELLSKKADSATTLSGYGITDAKIEGNNITLGNVTLSAASLDENGKVPSTQLPAYVDDVVEYDSKSEFPESGETGIIYIALDTNLTYRWGGSTYVEISQSLALGETETTAFAGNRGKAIEDKLSDYDTVVSNAANGQTAYEALTGITVEETVKVLNGEA